MFNPSKLVANSRFYVLVLSILLSLFIVGFYRQTIPSDELYYIRLQQVFGLLAVVYLYIAMIITPLSTIVGKKLYMLRLLFARRAIGVAVAYFVLLHILIVIYKQLGGISGIGLLPEKFQISLLMGLIATVILLIMAATSFDAVIRRMSFPKWKLLHRFVYVAGILTVLHVWMVGTHIGNQGVRIASYTALIVLFFLESIRMGIKLGRKLNLENSERNMITVFLFAILLTFVFVFPNVARPLHSGHEQVQEVE